MRRSIPLAILLLATTAGCSQAIDDGNGTTATRAENPANSPAPDAAESTAIPPELPAPRGRADRGTGPDVDPASAPGIAFDYRYSFRLEADRIAEIQREHQELCARYGPRCQITGVDYRAANAEDVEAMLSFAVDPAIAAQFGREGVRAVTAADGELTESSVAGTDVGASLKANTGQLDELQAELARVEARLAQRNLRWAERVRLDEQRQSLRRQIAALGETTGAQEHALATTPILFRYGSGALAPGPAREPTIGEATTRAADNFLGALKYLLIAFVTISPWVLTLLLLWVGFRAARKRWPAKPAAPASETEPAQA
ncbi:MAG TPA: DUF4349 domain-containing protein [Allosphingosinicella sp.]|nr:DUF4349 domain-containing protein [Allosphingosinicella sp.]